jgi:hypothetical protein
VDAVADASHRLIHELVTNAPPTRRGRGGKRRTRPPVPAGVARRTGSSRPAPSDPAGASRSGAHVAAGLHLLTWLHLALPACTPIMRIQALRRVRIGQRQAGDAARRRGDQIWRPGRGRRARVGSRSPREGELLREDQDGYHRHPGGAHDAERANRRAVRPQQHPTRVRARSQPHPRRRAALPPVAHDEVRSGVRQWRRQTDLSGVNSYSPAAAMAAPAT